MPASTILILDQDSAAAELIKSTLTRSGYQATVIGDVDEALRIAADFHLLVVDVLRGDRTPEDVCREIRGIEALSAVPVMCVAQTDDVEERVRFLEAGADDVMAKPFDGRELEARVEALLLRFQRSLDLTPAAVPGFSPIHRQVLLFFSPKGGVGTTTIAVNVAIALADRLGPDRVAIVDLDLQWGQVTTHLNLRPTMSIAEAAQDDAVADREALRTYLTRHDTGVAVLPAPSSPEQVSVIRAIDIERLLTTMREMFEVVVIDGASTLDERTRVVFGKADHVVLPLYPEISALKALHSLLDTFAESGSPLGSTTFVLNHLFAREMLKLRDIENTLAARVAVELPHEPIIYLKAVNEGVPLVRGAPRSGPAERLRHLADLLSGDGVRESAPEAPRRRGLLGSLARRA